VGQMNVPPKLEAKIAAHATRMLRAAIVCNEATTPSEAKAALLKAADILGGDPDNTDVVNGLRNAAQTSVGNGTIKYCQEIAATLLEEAQRMRQMLEQAKKSGRKSPWWKFW
jgi:hypothetical protein